eukprot:14181484-Ditylum_brightwellii.AAC.1
MQQILLPISEDDCDLTEDDISKSSNHTVTPQLKCLKSHQVKGGDSSSVAITLTNQATTTMFCTAVTAHALDSEDPQYMAKQRSLYLWWETSADDSEFSGLMT